MAHNLSKLMSSLILGSCFTAWAGACADPSGELEPGEEVSPDETPSKATGTSPYHGTFTCEYFGAETENGFVRMCVYNASTEIANACKAMSEFRTPNGKLIGPYVSDLDGKCRMSVPAPSDTLATIPRPFVQAQANIECAKLKNRVPVEGTSLKEVSLTSDAAGRTSFTCSFTGGIATESLCVKKYKGALYTVGTAKKCRLSLPVRTK